jgi:hypothetical protein
MAKQKKSAALKPPARSRSEESISLRSAESLGRVIGTLQRQLDHALRRFAGHQTPHTPRLHSTDGVTRSRRSAATRPRTAAVDDLVPGRRAAKTGKTKTPSARRTTATTTPRMTAKRASRPK